MRFFNFSNGAFSRVRRKKRRRAGQMPVCTNQEEALLWIALSVDDPGRIRKQMFPASSTTVGETTSRTHPRMNRACHVATRSHATAAAAGDADKMGDEEDEKKEDEAAVQVEDEKAGEDEEDDEKKSAEAEQQEEEEEEAEDPSLITGVHVTAAQRARYCATFLARQKLHHGARKTILKGSQQIQLCKGRCEFLCCAFDSLTCWLCVCVAIG